MVGCDLFNNSMVDYFLDNVEIVGTTGVKVKTEYVMMDDETILIPPGSAKIGVILSNPRNFSVRQELLGVPAGKNITAHQIGAAEIEVHIDGAEEGDDYALTLVMQSPDGLRDFPAYSLRIKCVSFETALWDFTVDGITPPIFDPAKNDFRVNVPHTRTTVTLGGTTVHPGAVVEIYAGKDDSGEVLKKAVHTVEITQGLDVGDNYFFIKITAPSSSVQSYAVTVYRAMDSEKVITGFSILTPVGATGTINEAAKTITVTVPYGTDLTGMTASASHIGASIDPDPAVAKSYTGPVEYTVTAANGSTSTYTVTVNVLPNTTKAIMTFNITNPVNVAGIIDETLKTITINVPYGTDVTAMTASASHTGASIDPDPATAKSYAGPVTYTVTAADGSTTTYTVTVNVASNTAKAITAFNITGPVNAAGVINEDAKTITVTVPYRTAVTGMTALASHSGASLDPDPAVAKSYAGPVTYTVTAADGTYQDYTVTVNVAKIASVTAVNGHLLSSDGFKKTGSDISGGIKAAITSVMGTDSLGTTITLASADYSVDALIPAVTGTTTSATLRVPATQTSTKADITKTFGVYIKNDARAITGFYFIIGGKKYGVGAGLTLEEGSGSISGNDITITVPNGTDVTNLSAMVSHTGASISPDPAVAKNYTSPVTYTVKAEDETTRNYSVTVKFHEITITGITVKGLSALSFGGLPASPVAANTPITITIDGGATVSGWYINVNKGPVSTTSSTGSFTAPADPGFYNVNVIATVEGVDYSGSFGITVK
jgi:hypothetical protein